MMSSTQPIAPWRATCIQMPSQLAARADSPTAARSIIDANVQRAVKLVTEACESQHPPRLVVLPEFAFQGPPHRATVQEWIEKACDSIPGRATAPLQRLAERYRIYIAGNLFERDVRWPGRFFNSCFLIDPRGEVILRYRRINTALWPSPHDFMDDYFAEYGVEGTFPVVDTELGRLAVIACGEIAVPEVSRAFMLRGAEVLLHPTNDEMSAGQEAAKTARAAENMMYVISANVAGPIGFSWDGKVPGGRSRIVDFRGETVAYRQDADETFTVSSLIDVEAQRRARNDLGLGNALLRARWEMYRPLLRDVTCYPPNAFAAQPMTNSAQTQETSAAALQTLLTTGVVRRPATP
ncbi:nitrilase-related carbon-nitrogen hydrolase [Peristeroidobacter soli]|uniref:nitrilase-related carbon-nitrogen hydrolase n=1 Tax=Peristeroidobacter soli TaxID=2497877 RepID=UPI00101D40C9|nr:nitrilase-related carbon-nitrogen hydrolase [Peristeroidobacter soli]